MILDQNNFKHVFLVCSLAFLMSVVFWGYEILLFTEANDWFFSAYVAESVTKGDTSTFRLDQFNTPNSLFLYTYLYLQDVIYFVSPYNLMKGILYFSFIVSLILVFRLSILNSSYAILYPLLMSYILVGGMVNYFMGIVVILLFMLKLERDNNLNTWEIIVFVLLAYHAHFMAMFPLMCFIFYHFGIKKAFLVGIAPFVLLVSYKLTNINYHEVSGDYGLINHILSIRRLLLPSLVDNYYLDRIYQYIFSSGINALYLISVLTLAWKYHKSKILNWKIYKLILFFLVIYFLVPASISGSGLNIHERLIIPFLIFVISYIRYEDNKLIIIFSFIGILVAINLIISQYKYDVNIYKDYGQYHCKLSANGADYGLKSPLTNRAIIGRSVYLAESIIDNKKVDSIKFPSGYGFFSASIAKMKENNPNFVMRDCTF
jgi:hypothetical protein